MKNILLLLFAVLAINNSFAQDVSIDGRLKPFLDDFFEYCKKYDIDTHEKLFKLKRIAIVDTLHLGPKASTLGMLTRDSEGKVENIVINWVVQLDQQILKVVAFHEFGHYFLEYEKHVCDDCGIIMSVVNSSYFDIANDWDNQVKKLFEDSPAYKKKRIASYATTSNNHGAGH